MPDFMVASGTTYRLITDQLGSVRQVVNASTGAIAQEITYDPFGEVISDSNPGFQPFGFAGGLYEPETGLVHFGAREYDAGLGRWTSEDPIGFGGGDTNLYGYVLADPVNLFDPNGMSFMCAGMMGCTGTSPGPFESPYDSAKNTVGPAAEEAAAYYAGVANDPDAGWLKKTSAYVGGSLASLATCDNFDKTALVLSLASAGGRVAGGSRAVSKTESTPSGKYGITKPTGRTKHGQNSMIGYEGRAGVSPWAIKDTLNNPIKVIEQSGGRTKYVGKHAVIVLNSKGKIVTGWPRGRSGVR